MDEELKNKLEALEANFNAFCEKHGYEGTDAANDAKSELKEIAEILRGMQPKEKTITDKRFERKHRREQLTGHSY